MTKLQEVQERLAQLDPNNRDNLVEIATLKTREAELIKQSALEEVEEKERAALEKSHEERVRQKQQQITYLLDSLEVDGISMRNLCLNEQAYNLLRASVEQAVMGQIEGLSEEIKGSDEREKQLQRQNEHLQETVKKLETDLQAATETLNKTKFDLEDANNKRDAAYRAKEQAEELLKLKQEELDLERAEKVVGAREAYKVVDQSEQLRKLAEDFKSTRVKVMNVRWEDDLKKTHKLAELVESGETVRFHFFEHGKYLEVTPEEGLQFRLEQSQEKVSDIPLVIPAPEIITNAPVTEQQFPSGNDNVGESAADTADGEGTAAESGCSSDYAPVSRAEFETLEKRVTALENVSGRWAS